jgi:hypothetical protein
MYVEKEEISPKENEYTGRKNKGQKKEKRGAGGKEQTGDHNMAMTEVGQHKISITFRGMTLRNNSAKPILIKKFNVVQVMRLHKARTESSWFPCGRRYLMLSSSKFLFTNKCAFIKYIKC